MVNEEIDVFTEAVRTRSYLLLKSYRAIPVRKRKLPHAVKRETGIPVKTGK